MLQQFTSKIKPILLGWWLHLTNDKTTRKLSRGRRLVCDGCPFNNENYCEQCGCYIPAKTRILTESCPQEKW